jgi:hypothetical protein
MRKVEVVKAFLWAPDGIRVREVPVGEVLEGEGAEIAMQMKCGREVKALDGAPKNKAKG